MKDDKPKKYVPRDVPEYEYAAPVKTEPPPAPKPAVAAPEPAPEAALPVGTHFENLKKLRRAGKA